MKLFLVGFLLSLALVAKADFDNYDEYSPEQENLALGVNAEGHPLDELDDEEGKTKKLDPMAQCLWDWLVCWSSGKKSPKPCGQIYSECTRKAKGKPQPLPPVPPPES